MPDNATTNPGRTVNVPTYAMPARCANCGERFTRHIPKGEERPRGTFTCLRCGCDTARVSDPAWSDDPPRFRPRFGPPWSSYAQQPEENA